MQSSITTAQRSVRHFIKTDDGKEISTDVYWWWQNYGLLSMDAKFLFEWLRTRDKLEISMGEISKCGPPKLRHVPVIRNLMAELVQKRFVVPAKKQEVIFSGRKAREAWRLKNPPSFANQVHWTFQDTVPRYAEF